MKIVSHADHEALCVLLDKAIHASEARLVELRKEKEEMDRKIAAFKALPFFKRLFSFSEPCDDHISWSLHFAKRRLKHLKRIQELAGYELQIELSSEEVDLLV
jgi:hypothetical protein